MDFIQSLDPSKLVLAGMTLSFVTSPFAAPPYNLAIFLFGIYVSESSEAFIGLQALTALLGASTIADFIWMLKNSQNGFIKFLTVLLLILKIPTFLAFGNLLRERRTQHGFGSLNIPGGDVSGPTIWSMPGGFTSGGRDGYQSVGDEPAAQPAAPKPMPATHSVPHTAQPSNPVAPGSYQNV